MRRSVRIGLLLCLSASWCFAQSSLRDLTDELIRNNAEIQAARYRYEAATKRPSQLSALPEPKVTLVDFGVGHPFSTLNVSNFAYLGFGISQEFPFPGKLALAGEEAQKESESERETYRSIVLDITTQLKVAYYDWFYIRKAIEITQKNRDLLERFEKISRARYSVGKGIQQDVLKAQVELSGLAQQVEILEQRRASVEAKINSLLNRDPETAFGLPADLKRSDLQLDLRRLMELIDNSPRLRARQFQVDSRAVGIARARKEYRPDLNLSFQWQKTGSMFPDFYMAMAEIKLPVYFRRKQRLGTEEAAARLQESRYAYQSIRQELVFAVKDEYLKARTSERLLALFESGIIPQSSLSLESALAGYEVGNVDFLTLTNNLMNLLSYEMQYYEELSKHEQALARLEPLVGTELTRP